MVVSVFEILGLGHGRQGHVSTVYQAVPGRLTALAVRLQVRLKPLLTFLWGKETAEGHRLQTIDRLERLTLGPSHILVICPTVGSSAPLIHSATIHTVKTTLTDVALGPTQKAGNWARL